MTLAQLEAVYKANLVLSELEGLQAVYLQGYYDGAGTTINANTPIQGVLVTRPAPATIVKLMKPDSR